MHGLSKPERPDRYRYPAPHGVLSRAAKGADCKSAVKDFGGSSPSCPTILSVMKPGMIIQCVSKNTPVGWLECRGQRLKIEDYEELYEAIGAEFNEEKETTHFRVPRIPTEAQGIRHIIYTGK